MARVKLTTLLKLGTGLRYLIDVREGMEFGDKHILQNCRAILDLIPDSGFNDTAGSAPYRQLEQLHAELQKASTVRVRINAKEAGRLEWTARRVRDRLYTESEGKYVHLGQGTRGFQIALTLTSLVLLCVLAASAPGLIKSLDQSKSWLIAAAVSVMVLTGIWSSRGLKAPGLWLGFIGLITSVFYAATGG